MQNYVLIIFSVNFTLKRISVRYSGDAYSFPVWNAIVNKG